MVRLIYPSFITPEKIEIENIELAEFELDSTSNNNSHSGDQYDHASQNFAFDPNTASEEDLVKLGFKPRTAQTLIKFRSKGFTFRNKEDLKKIYGMSERLYQKLEPYIVIRNSTNNKVSDSKTSDKKNINASKKLELNSADSLSLIELKGIGPGYAKRILKYRALLGGFVSIDQIKEIYGMNDELFELIKQQCSIDPKLITKININSVEFKALNKHPYINYELTKHIFNFKKNTRITNANFEDLIQDQDLIQKLLPYMNFE